MSTVGDVESEHTANLLGALSLVLHDRMMEAISEAIGQSDSAATALSWSENFADQPSVGLLHRMLGLTPSGAVRLVDRLETEGYLERRRGVDGRSTRVHLTRTGRRAARKGTAARAQVLDQALSSLSTEERQVLDRLLSRLLVGMRRGPDAQRFMCRLCDARACGHAEGRCPVRNAGTTGSVGGSSTAGRIG
jgi:DNA-binding MarR family transcriptional regulator